MRHIDTPHVPHGWEARVLYEETTRTLLCGDLFTHVENGPEPGVFGCGQPAIDAEQVFHAMTMAPNTGAVLPELADLEPTTLALMHGSSFTGDGGAALRTLGAQLNQQNLSAA